MKPRGRSILVLALCAAAAPALAADERQLSSGVYDLIYTRTPTTPGLKLENVAVVKTPEARMVQVTSANPTIKIDGRVTCKAGRRPYAARLYFGTVFLNNGKLVTGFELGSSALVNLSPAAGADDFTVSATLPVTKVASDAAIDLTFNPARTFEQKLKAFVAKGGSAAEYLRQTEAFDMGLTLSMVAWCKDTQTQVIYPAVLRRGVQITSIYEGDPAVTGGLAPRAPGGVLAPEAPKPPRAKN